ALQILVGAPPVGRHGIRRNLLDDIERGGAVDAERVQSSEQPLQSEPDPGRALRAEYVLDVAAVAVAVDGAAQSHRQQNRAVDLVGLVVTDRARFALPSGE